MKHAAAFLLFFLATWWLWMLLAGEWNHTQWIAATAAATVAAALGEIARSRAQATPGAPTAMLASIPMAMAMVFVDFAIVMGALATRKRGTFRRTPTDVADTPQRRAWATFVASFSPNAYIVDIDPESGMAETHHMIPVQKSQDLV